MSEFDAICVGTFSRITAARIRSFSLSGYGEEALKTASLFGNDAVIVANILSKKRRAVALQVINPSTSDMKILEQLNLDNVVINEIGRFEGPTTEALCLETLDGKRYWIFSRPIAASAAVILSPARIAYFDLYDELEDLIIEHITIKLEEYKNTNLFFNLSSSRILDKAARLRPHNPTFVQASQPMDSGNPAELLANAGKLRAISNSSVALLTAGETGFAVSTKEEEYLVVPDLVIDCIGIGAGAMISAGFIDGILRGETVKDSVIEAMREAIKLLR